MPIDLILDESKKRLQELFEQSKGFDCEVFLEKSGKELFLLLAARFDHDLRQGGFAQFFYNMNGNFLADVEDMLIQFNAIVAHEFFVQAVKACIANKAEYESFLQSDYLSENSLKNELHAISLDYLACHVDFSFEVRDYICGSSAA